MNIELLKDGCFLMLLGMSFVFVFLQIMIWVMQINAKIIGFINKRYPETEPEDKYISKKKTTNNDAEIALAIACAYRCKNLN